MVRTTIASLVVSLAVAACGSGATPTPEEPDRHVLTGTVELVGTVDEVNDKADRNDCSGRGGYDDLRSGAEVTVRDASGAIAGLGRLEAGEAMRLPDPQDRNASARDRVSCVWPYEVADLVDSEFYLLMVAGRETWETTYSREELEALGWEVHLLIGG